MSNNITVNNILFREDEKKCNLFFVIFFFFCFYAHIYTNLLLLGHFGCIVKEFFHWN